MDSKIAKDFIWCVLQTYVIGTSLNFSFLEKIKHSKENTQEKNNLTKD